MLEITAQELPLYAHFPLLATNNGNETSARASQAVWEAGHCGSWRKTVQFIIEQQVQLIDWRSPAKTISCRTDYNINDNL
ncbi:hypothetical protein [Paenibacillus sp. GCM10012303]|uniref:hypothetical protein n=1 Tax=Paenibacillus sp. GCM10012303 TaxID=3317340 RepID=UPI003605FC57